MSRSLRQANHVPFKVLVIDDDPKMLSLSVSWLKAAGFDVISASGEQDGFALLRSEHPDLLVADLKMPQMDGFEFCRRVRADSVLPVLVFSTVPQAEGRERSIEAGANRYIVKDFDLTELIEAVRDLTVGIDEGS